MKKREKSYFRPFEEELFFCGFPKARLKISFFTLVATLLPFS